MTNPILPPTALLRPKNAGLYDRSQIYDPTFTDDAYLADLRQKIVPYPGSLVRDVDETPLWVTGVDPVTMVPSYVAVPLSTNNDAVVSMLNYGNSVLRLYLDYRALPYPATPDAKCIFIGKSPRFYSLTSNTGTAQESVVSQYFDSTNTLISQMVPLAPLDSSMSSWYLPRCHISQVLTDNEEITVKIFDEAGTEVYSALLFTKESAVINEDVLYAPKITGMTVTGNQQLANGTFYLYEKQDFDSLGLTANLVYDDGSITTAPVDGVKCILYGQHDFISSFSGLTQNVSVKYYRSRSEAISPSIGDPTGEMITITVPVTVIPNILGVTVKIMAIPQWNSAQARYQVRYWAYWADGRSHADVSGYVSITQGSLVTDSSYFGVAQTYTIGVDMNLVDPTHYPTSTLYQQNVVIKFGAPTTLVKWSIRDANTSQYIYGLDTVLSRRPLLKYDNGRQQYFVSSALFANQAAFINSFYTQASPPYDPSISQIPQQPTHFVVRDIVSGAMIISAPIALTSYSQLFSVIGDATGAYVGRSVMIEFLNIVSSSVSNILYGVPVDVVTGSYV
jgi:hypothetical protein